MTFSFVSMHAVSILRNGPLLVWIPGGHSARDFVLGTDVVQLGHAMANGCTQTADMTGITTHHALDEMFGVSRFMALTAEVGGTAESGEVGEVLLGTIFEILNTLDVVKATAILHQTLEEDVWVVYERMLFGGSSTTRCGGSMAIVGLVIVIVRSTTWLAALQFDFLFPLPFFFLNETLVDHGLVEIGVVSLFVADPTGIAVILAFRALPGIPLFTHRWI